MGIFRCSLTWQKSWCNNLVIQTEKYCYFVLMFVVQNCRTTEAGEDLWQSPGSPTTAQAEPPRAGCPLLWPAGLRVSPRICYPQLLWASCATAKSVTVGKAGAWLPNLLSISLSCPENTLHSTTVGKIQLTFFFLRHQIGMTTVFFRKSEPLLGVAHCHPQLFTVDWWISVPCFMLKGAGQKCIASIAYLMIFWWGLNELCRLMSKWE